VGSDFNRDGLGAIDVGGFRDVLDNRPWNRKEMSPAIIGRWLVVPSTGSPGIQVSVARWGKGGGGKKRKKGERKGGFTWSSDLMRHVGQEFGFRSVGELGGFSCSSISLDTVSQVEHHLVDLPLQLVHFPRGFDCNQLRKVSVCRCVGDVAKSSDLSS
jgi:hypothetical protein